MPGVSAPVAGPGGRPRWQAPVAGPGDRFWCQRAGAGAGAVAVQLGRPGFQTGWPW
jgi:hypothetical protein